MIKDVDENNDGVISEDEFLQLVADHMKSKQPGEEMVELFKAFGATDAHDVITIGDLDKALKEGGETFNDAELTLIFEELAGAFKRHN